LFTNMTSLAKTRDALFVPQGSSLSQVELLTWSLYPHISQKKGACSHIKHDEHARKGFHDFGPQLEKDTKCKPEDAVAAAVRGVPSDGLQRCDMSIRWLSATGSEDLEFHLGVCIDIPLRGIFIVG
jgi:hypothetical protein